MNFMMFVHVCIVTYAADVASAGLDLSSTGTREDIWTKEKSRSVASMNTPMPWYPEMLGYVVSEVKVGETCMILIV